MSAPVESESVIERHAVTMLGTAGLVRGFLVQYMIAALVTIIGVAGVVVLSAIGATIPDVLSLVVMAGVGYLYGAQQANNAVSRIDKKDE